MNGLLKGIILPTDLQKTMAQLIESGDNSPLNLQRRPLGTEQVSKTTPTEDSSCSCSTCGSTCCD